MGPDIGLAASARDWPDRLHRFLLDHGGGRIVDRVMGPEQAAAGTFELLLIDDICSFLTPHLVSMLKQSGIEVLGVYVPGDGADAKRRLLECGISDVIETEASPEEFLQQINQTLAHRIVAASPGAPSARPLTIAVTGASEGVGMTEVSVALANALGTRIPTALVDLDPAWPSVAQRLDLPVHPNVRTALDHALHSPDRLGSAMHTLGSLNVVGGRADGGQGEAISRHESLILIEAMSEVCEVLVADLGPLFAVAGGLAREFDSVIVVGAGNPVGITRMMKTIDAALSANPEQSVLAAVNLGSSSGHQRREAFSELANAFPAVPVVTIPYDRHLAQAAWDGSLVTGPRYSKAIDAMSDVVVRSLS